jgi:6-pyruvoyl-tetrahydropterin synthase
MHGHSAVIEVLLEGTHLDKAGMLYDFGLMKGTVKQFIDMFDHCFVYWDKDDPSYISNIISDSDRWIALPFNPTAEMLSLFFMDAINHIIRHTAKINGEDKNLHCCGVIYHETESGYAHCCEADLDTMWDKNNFYRIGLSDAVKEDISGDLALLLTNPNATINPEYSPYNQVKANPTGQDNDWR